MGVTIVQRRQAVRSVLARAEETGESLAPWEHVEGVAEHFESEDDVLREIHAEWLRLLSARLQHPEPLAEAGRAAASRPTGTRTPGNVRDLYDDLCADQPTLRRLLDVHCANPVLWEPTAQEHALLARAGGLAAAGVATEEAAVLGRALVHQRVPAQRGALR